MLRRFYRWIGTDFSSRWWLRHCLKRQTRKTSRHTIRWPTFSLPLPNGPGVLVSVGYFGPLPLAPRGNAYILLFTVRFSRRVNMYATTEAYFTASSMDDILVDRYIPLWEGVLAVMYKTHWSGLSSPSWKHVQDLQHRRLHILRHWPGTPAQHRQSNRLYRQMRIGAAHCKLTRTQGEMFLAPG